MLTELLEGGHRLPRRGRQRARGGDPRRARRRRDRRTPTSRGRSRPGRGRGGADGPRSSTPHDIRDLLRDNLEHPRWDEVAERCLTCGNCTLACPTCFCSAVEDANDLNGAAERARVWDSCFSVDYSYIHGGASGSRRGRATASGSPTSSAPGTTSSTARAASAAGVASPGARSESTSRRRSPRSVRPGRRTHEDARRCRRREPVVRRASTSRISSCRGLRPQHRLRAPATTCSARATRPTPSTWCATGASCSRRSSPAAAR